MPRVRRLVVALAAVVAALAVAPGAAAATVTTKKSIWGPLVHNGVPQMPVYADLGVGIWQRFLRWNEVAPQRPANPRDPSDPAYRWPKEIDDAIEQGKPYQIRTLLLVFGAPRWANGGGIDYAGPTNIKDYGDFLVAAGKRYPAIRHWMIWGEPSRATGLLQPAPGKTLEEQIADTKGRAEYYSRLLDMSYVRLKRMSRRNLVIGGNSYNGITPVPGFVRPLSWVRKLELPNGKPPRMDMYGHNPFSLRRPRMKDKPQRSNLADLSNADTLGRTVDRHLKRRKRDRPLRLFFSEYSLPTNRPGRFFRFSLTRNLQASWIKSAMRIVRRDKRIYSLGYFQAYDEAERSDKGHETWGLLTNDGKKKPGYFAFRGS